MGQAIYGAWQRIAADALPAKLAFLGADPNDYSAAAAPAWMRPGVPLHRESQRAIRELMEEINAATP